MLSLNQSIIDSLHQLPDSTDDTDNSGNLADFASQLEQHDVVQTVLAQNRKALARSQTALVIAEETPWIGAVIAWVDLTDERVGKTLDAFATGSPKFRGVCHPVDHEEENRWLLRDDVVRGLGEVAQRGLSLDLFIGPRSLPSVVELAKAMPELRMVINRLGAPLIAQGIREPWGVYMQNIAPYKNVCCKVSGLVTRDVQPDWRVSHIRGYVEAAMRLFGSERLMFGSDWPTYTAVADYGQVLETALAAAGPLTRSQQERFLRGSASDFYGLR